MKQPQYKLDKLKIFIRDIFQRIGQDHNSTDKSDKKHGCVENCYIE